MIRVALTCRKRRMDLLFSFHKRQRHAEGQHRSKKQPTLDATTMQTTYDKCDFIEFDTVPLLKRSTTSQLCDQNHPFLRYPHRTYIRQKEEAPT